MIPHMEGRRPPPTPEEYAEFFDYLDRTFPRGGASPKPPPDPPPDLTPEEVQRRLDELFGDMPLRPEPTPASRRPDPSTPEELQQRLNEAFAGTEVPNAWPSVRPPAEPPPKLTPEE